MNTSARKSAAKPLPEAVTDLVAEGGSVLATDNTTAAPAANQRPEEIDMSKREAYVQKMKARIDEWSADIERLEARARGAEADMKIKYQEQLAAMRQQREQAREKMRELEDASEDAWERLREGMESAWERMSKAFKDAADRFR
jgi:chromosome segregation ATPase